MELLPDNLKEVQPTVVFGVPRVWEKIYDKVSARLQEPPGQEEAGRVCDGRRVRLPLRAQRRTHPLGRKLEIRDRPATYFQETQAPTWPG